MATFADVMAADHMPPIALVGENLSIWSQGRWMPYTIEWLEQMPYGAAFSRDFGALAAQTWGAATLVTQLQLDEDQLLQVRFKPLLDFEIRLWETRSTGRFVVKNVHATIDTFTQSVDPHMKSSTIFVLGKERDAYMELYNPTDYALVQTPVKFWGYRFALRKLNAEPDRSTRIPAEGRV